MLELPVQIDRASGVPVYIQLEEQIRLLVRKGALQTGDALPTVRSFAVSLGINANTVSRVYRDLQREGVLRLERGVGTFVARSVGSPADRKQFQKLERRVTDAVALAKEIGLTAAELSQLVENRWKEEEDAQR